MEAPNWDCTKAEFTRLLLLDGRTADSVRTYISNFRLYFFWCLERELHPGLASSEAFALFYTGQIRSDLSRKTVRNRLNACRAYYRLIKATPDPTADVKAPNVKTMPKRPVPIEDQRRIVYGAPSRRDEAMWRCLIDTGMRVGELAKMKIENINWRENLVLIDGKGAKQREVWISDETLQMIRSYIGSRYHGPVWLNQYGAPITRDAARKNFAKLAKRQGVRAHPHQLRATFANAFLKAGGDLGALRVAMGHSDIATTAHYAAGTENERALAWMRQLNLSSRLV